MLAYRVEDGTIGWSAASGSHSYSSPQLSTVAGRRLVLMVSDDGLVGLDPADGALVWDYEWSGQDYRTLQPLVPAPSTVLVTSGFEGTRRLDLRVEPTGLIAEERWTSRGMKSDFNDYAVHSGVLSGFDPNILAAIDVATGERHWKGGRYGAGQLLLLPDADQLLVLSERGELVLLRATPDSHQEITRFQALEGKTWNHPVLIGSRLYVRNAEEAVAFEMPLP